MHVDVDYKWSGGNPAELFELREQLGKGYILISESISLSRVTLHFNYLPILERMGQYTKLGIWNPTL